MVSLDKFSGMNVIAAGGDILGEVKGAEINPNTWQVTHLQVKLSNTASDQLRFKKDSEPKQSACPSIWFPQSATS